MKKFLATLCCGLLSAALTFSFAACGETGNEPNSGNSGDQTNQGNQGTTQTPEPPETLVSDKVTQTEWDKAFADESFTNVKVEMTGSANETWQDENGKIVTGLSTCDSLYLAADGKECFKSHVKWVETLGGVSEITEETYKKYGVSANNEYLVFWNGEYGKWQVKHDAERILFDQMWYGVGSGYEMFSYSDDAGAYVATYDESFEGSTIDATFTVKIKDGKLMFFDHSYIETIEGLSDISTDGETYTFTYGGQSVVISDAPTTQDICGKFNFYELDTGHRYYVGDTMLGSDTPLTEDYLTYTFDEDGIVTVISQGGIPHGGTFEINYFLITVTIEDIESELVWRDEGEIALRTEYSEYSYIQTTLRKVHS